MLIVAGIIAVFALMVLSNGVGARQQTNTSACLNNLRSIAEAAEMYHAAVGTYPTGTSVAVTQQLFANPKVPTVTYLSGQPVDPADVTGVATYKYTYYAPTATVGEYYTITCPGLHPKETLSDVPGGSTETTGTMTFNSSTQGITAN
jgi:type II secretory pathway pseudopilin PulG